MKYYCSYCEDAIILTESSVKQLYHCPVCDNSYVKLMKEVHRITFDKTEGQEVLQ